MYRSSQVLFQCPLSGRRLQPTKIEGNITATTFQCPLSGRGLQPSTTRHKARAIRFNAL